MTAQLTTAAILVALHGELLKGGLGLELAESIVRNTAQAIVTGAGEVVVSNV